MSNGYPNTSTTSDVTIETIMDAMKKAQALRLPDTPDVFLLTYAAEARLRRAIPDLPSVPQFQTYMGIPYESYPTMAKLIERAWELWKSGKTFQWVE